MSSESKWTAAASRPLWSISTMPTTSALTSPGVEPRTEERMRMSARRCPRVAMTVDVRRSNPTSATARMFVRWSARPRKTPALTTRRRSAVQCPRPMSRPSPPSRGPRSSPKNARPLGLPRFPIAVPAAAVPQIGRARRPGRPRRTAPRRFTLSPSTVRSWIIRHSASKPSCEVPYEVLVRSAPKLLSRCTASMWMLRSGVRSKESRMDAANSLEVKSVARR